MTTSCDICQGAAYKAIGSNYCVILYIIIWTKLTR